MSERTKMLAKARTDLAIARATARQHVNAAAKYTAIIETFGDEFQEVNGLDDKPARWPIERNDHTLADYKEMLQEATRLANRWQLKAEKLTAQVELIEAFS